MGYGALARVISGWTGTIAAHGVTVTPRPRESVASLIARLVAGVATATSERLTVSVSSSGVLTLSSTSTFTLTATNNTATRTGFSGTYTGATSYTAASAYSSRYVPTLGLRADNGAWVSNTGGPVADGSLGVSGILAPGRCEVTMWTSFADAWASEQTVRPDVYDVWHDGRIFARLCVDTIRRTAPSKLRTTEMMLRLSGSTVTE
jgi:hypothetical protein